MQAQPCTCASERKLSMHILLSTSEIFSVLSEDAETVLFNNNHEQNPGLLLCSLRQRSPHRLKQGHYEAGFTLQWDKLICFVHSGRWNRVGASVRCDDGFRRKCLMVGDARKADRR